MAGVPVDLRLVSDSVSAAAQSGPVSDRIIATAQTDDAGHFALSASGTAQVLGAAQANGGYANLQIEAVTDTAMFNYYFSAQNTSDGWVTSETWPKNFTIGAASPGVTPVSRTVARSLAASIRGVSPDFICGGVWQTVDTQTNFTTVGEYHTIGEMSGYFKYARSGHADSDISVAVSSSATGPWSLSGTAHVGTATSSTGTWNRGPLWSHRVRTQFQYRKQRFWYCQEPQDNWRVIAGTFAAGAEDGADVSDLDHNCDIYPYNQYDAPFAKGTSFDRYDHRAFDYGGAVTVFTVSLSAQSGYSSDVWMHWKFTANRILCGDNDFVTQSARLFAGT
jgi:hypothetical protein